MSNFRSALKKSFLNRAQAIFFGRLALYSTYFFLWVYKSSIFLGTNLDLALIALAFTSAFLAYRLKESPYSRWIYFITLSFDVFLHIFFTRNSGYLLSPLMVIHPLLTGSFLLLFHNGLMLIVPLLALPIAMMLGLIADPGQSITQLLGLMILNCGIDTFMVFLINHPHSFEQKLTYEMLSLEKKLRELEILKERQRISREFHDGAGAKLTSIIMQCEYLLHIGPLDENSVHQIKDSAIESIDDMRRSIAFLNGDFDIVEQVELMLEKIRLRHRLVTESINLETLKKLSQNQQIACCRIIQEGLTNALKHSLAKKVSLNIIEAPKSITIAIKDDGIGFKLPEQNQGFGIRNMVERSKQMGGILELSSTIGFGSQIDVKIPIDI